MPTCPNGHQSGSEDWCEVCGHRMAGAVPPPPPPPPAPGYGYPQGAPPPGYPGQDATQQAEICPQCRTPREAMAPFCEECRWNFLTNTATSYTPVAPQNSGQGPGPGGLNLPPGFQAQQPPQPQHPQPPQRQAPPQGPPPPPPAQPQQTQQPRDPYEYQSSRPSQINRPAEPLAPEQSGHQAPPSPFQQQPDTFQRSDVFQQPAAPSPPAFQQQAPPPAPPQQQQPPQQQPQGNGNDDWMLPPPSQQQQQQQPQHQQQMPQQHSQPTAPASWTATVGPDREYFMAMMQRSGPDAAGLNLPAYSPEQQRRLTGNQITIGRRRHSTGEAPDIDLAVPPEDPGVSHQHAVLVQQPDGSWAVVDQNSTNGTTVNGAEEPIQPYVPIPLQDGDRVHVGAWTTITVRRG
ncbi:FHA domain-containing protein [Streptomyces sp. ISL-98]|uniref:FHA domain-containing protein n=1 Tax=Streptomyces sp. ISL-98 TaxID=2819192 RepID=UPI001BEC6B78|nr:FHA domain-containing protein [Streptomyces sp. ISL-98]MBT2505283.1 FHA domain-containing protein [Streptomyces sp. ISL-98]